MLSVETDDRTDVVENSDFKAETLQPKTAKATKSAAKNIEFSKVKVKVSKAETEADEVETDEVPIRAAKNILFDDEEDEAPSSFEEVREATAPSAESRYREFDTLFTQWRDTGDPSLRERLILMNRNLVSFIARKFLDRGEMSEDIMQQGLIGLINALDNFDPSRGTRFATFATPTIMGEIRRYLRDKTWTMRVPRRLQELHVSINHRVELLTQQLDRSPTYAEIARSLGVEVEEVIEALEMPHAMEPMSIDEALPNARGDSGATISDQIGAEDADLESWNDHAILQAALEKLPTRERQVLQLVYFQEHTQLEIARLLKISQMNVSRIQRRALARLRELMNSNDI